MDTIIDILLNYGYVGMFIAAFVAGSVFPLSSEVVMAGLQAAGLQTMPLVVWATIGNTLGSMFNYGVGRVGRLDWREKYLKVKQEKVQRAQDFMAEKGAWMGFFAFLPILGSCITVALGLMRANIVISMVSIFLGKFIRYMLLAYGVTLLL